MTIDRWSRGVRLAPSLVACLLLLRVAVPSSAQQPAGRHVLLHRIADADSVVYILGSVHLARADLYPLGASIEQAFAESERLAVEVDVRAVDEGALSRSVVERGLQPAGRTLRGELGEQGAERLGARLAGLGMRADSLDPFKPWVACTMLPAMELLLLGYDPAQGVDLHFLARAGDREIVELETVQSQLDLLAGFSDAEQLALLADYLAGADTMADEMAALLDAWLAGDAAGMEKLLDADLGGSEVGRRVEQLMLRQRDAAMAERIAGLLASPGTTFVVIGAAHTIGEGSVVDLLARRGFSVTTLRD